MSNSLRPFHLAVPVDDLSTARHFYANVLGLIEGRSSDKWVDFDFYGHQFVIHEVKKKSASDSNPVDGHDVPVPHFGVILEMKDWRVLASKLKSAKVKFIVEPYIRFEGQPGEQATLFFEDPCGNALEFKAFEDLSQLFAKT
jgi:extradiol dioxygenase family protein